MGCGYTNLGTFGLDSDVKVGARKEVDGTSTDDFLGRAAGANDFAEEVVAVVSIIIIADTRDC